MIVVTELFKIAFSDDVKKYVRCNHTFVLTTGYKQNPRHAAKLSLGHFNTTQKLCQCVTILIYALAGDPSLDGFQFFLFVAFMFLAV